MAAESSGCVHDQLYKWKIDLAARSYVQESECSCEEMQREQNYPQQA